jgi:hypothetical protein
VAELAAQCHPHRSHLRVENKYGSINSNSRIQAGVAGVPQIHMEGQQAAEEVTALLRIHPPQRPQRVECIQI